jgi:subtilase family serine protease
MTFRLSARSIPMAAASLLAIALGSGTAHATTPAKNPHTAPDILKNGKDLGRETGDTKLNLVVWLNLHDRDGFYARVEDLYKPGSPTYHQWLTPAQLKPYMPTAAEAEAVKAELAAHNIQVLGSDKNSMGIRISGRTSDIEEAFSTEIHRVNYNGAIVHTSTTEPQLSGKAVGTVYHVGGLGSVRMKSMALHPINPRTGKAFPGVPVHSKTNGVFYASDCFYAPETVHFSGVSDYDGTTPVSATYKGLAYGANPNNTAVGTLAPCGYSPAQVYGFYGMSTAYELDYKGQGQTVVLVDAYDESGFIENDLATFSSIYGLPAPDSSNFTIYNPTGSPGLNGSGSGWDTESDLDVEWSHAIAPGAKIAFVQAFNDEDENIQFAMYYAVDNKLGNSLSGSFGYPEAFEGSFASSVWNQVVAYGASQGVAMNFSTGDSGDNVYDYGVATISNPSSSPFATAVGGTSVAQYGTVFTTGWGNNLTILQDGLDEDGGGYVDNPPYPLGFYGGSGGGSSMYFAKPDYQSSLPGTTRQVPDVSALADPYTGAEFVYTEYYNGQQYVSVIGGTSLASPIFAGMWAIVDQIAGTSLGQAAPYIAELAAAHSSAIIDVVPTTGPKNTTGSVTDPSGTIQYSAGALVGPTTNAFTSAIWNDGYGFYANLSFGTDSSLKITPGWDNVTGYGTPNFKGLIYNLNPATYKPKQ